MWGNQPNSSLRWSIPFEAFEIVNGNQIALRTGSQLNFQSKSKYTVEVRATDPAGLSVAHQFDINVENVNQALIEAIQNAAIVFDDGVLAKNLFTVKCPANAILHYQVGKSGPGGNWYLDGVAVGSGRTLTQTEFDRVEFRTTGSGAVTLFAGVAEDGTTLNVASLNINNTEYNASPHIVGSAIGNQFALARQATILASQIAQGVDPDHDPLFYILQETSGAGTWYLDGVVITPGRQLNEQSSTGPSTAAFPWAMRRSRYLSLMDFRTPSAQTSQQPLDGRIQSATRYIIFRTRICHLSFLLTGRSSISSGMSGRRVWDFVRGILYTQSTFSPLGISLSTTRW